MKIKKGDNVIILTGKDRGKKGKVLRTMSVAGRLVVEGVNVKHRRLRPKRSGQKGQVVDMPLPVDRSNVGVFCATCGKAARLRARLEKGKKVRICARCKKEI